MSAWDQRCWTRPGPRDARPDHTLDGHRRRAHGHRLDVGPVRADADRARLRSPAARVMAIGPHGTQLPGATLLELALDHVSVGEPTRRPCRASEPSPPGSPPRCAAPT
ncbi:hypothetical protein ACIO13_23135 [Streptomyces sp. NPDC087425]|uniref:hypothetical protein n=1 Tax=Streptomyces sp. NPDC087425 TaxID=3365787 RepID=UPI00380FC2D6